MCLVLLCVLGDTMKYACVLMQPVTYYELLLCNHALFSYKNSQFVLSFCEFGYDTSI